MTERILLDAGTSGPDGWSQRQQVIRCPYRQQLLAARGGDDGAKSDALIRGSLVHVGLAHYDARLQAEQQGWDPEAYYTSSDAVKLTAERHGWGTEWIPVVLQVLRQWYETYGRSETVVAVEHRVTFDVPCAGKLYPYSMRLDLITERDGRIWVNDHKSTGYVNKRKLLAFSLAGNILALQWWGKRAYGDRLGGVVLRIIEWGAVKPGMTAKKIRLLAVEPASAPEALERWPETVRFTAEIKPWLRTTFGDRWPMALSEQGPCFDRYSDCPFVEICQWG